MEKSIASIDIDMQIILNEFRVHEGFQRMHGHDTPIRVRVCAMGTHLEHPKCTTLQLQGMHSLRAHRMNHELN